MRSLTAAVLCALALGTLAADENQQFFSFSALFDRAPLQRGHDREKGMTQRSMTPVVLTQQEAPSASILKPFEGKHFRTHGARKFIWTATAKQKKHGFVSTDAHFGPICSNFLIMHPSSPSIQLCHHHAHSFSLHAPLECRQLQLNQN